MSTIAMLLLAGAGTAFGQNSEWVPVTGAETLRSFMSGLKTERALPNGELARGEYFADGTGVLREWGGIFHRTWEVKGEDKVCISSAQETVCQMLEKHVSEDDLHRVKHLTTGKYHEFRVVSDHLATSIRLPSKAGPEMEAGKASAEEIAAELANPNTAMATMTLRLQFRSFEGDLPDADDQTSTQLVFQPTMPFPVGKGKVVFFHPAIPVLFDQPVFDAGSGEFEGETGLGDISFDLGYGVTKSNGTILGAGIVSSLPTATKDSLGSDRFTLGPEVLVGRVSKTSVLAFFPNHQWDVGGWGDKDINLTTAQLFGIYLPGGGWNIGTKPIISYDHNAEEWTVPLNITGGKVVIWGGRPWKLGVEINYYVEKPDAFGPEWMISFSVAPVVKNVVADWFGLGD